MAENPYAGVSENFSRGMSQGQQWAEGMANIDVKMKMAAQQQQQLDFQRQQHQYEQGKWMTDTVGKIAEMENGKTKNLLIQNFRKNVMNMGGQDPEILSTMLTDPTQVGLLRGYLNKLYDPSTPEDLRQKIMISASQNIGDKEIVAKLQDADKALSQIREARARGEEDRKTNAQKSSLEKPEKNVKVTQETFKILSDSKAYQNYAQVREGTQKLEQYIKNPSPVTDVASLYGMVKAMDPSTGVREGELTIANAANSFTGRIKLFVQKMLVGDALTDEQRMQILNMSRTNLKTSLGAYDNFREGVSKNAVKNGLAPEEFDPGHKIVDQDKAYIAKLDENARQAKELAKGNAKGVKDPTESVTPAEDVVRQYQQQKPELVKKLMQAKGKRFTKKQLMEQFGAAIPEALYDGLGIK